MIERFTQINQELTDIRITNKMTMSVAIHIHGMTSRLHPGLTWVMKERARDFNGIYYSYGCELDGKLGRVNFDVFGGSAPRSNNKFEVRDQGIYLIKEDTNESLQVAQWRPHDPGCFIL